MPPPSIALSPLFQPRWSARQGIRGAFGPVPMQDQTHSPQGGNCPPASSEPPGQHIRWPVHAEINPADTNHDRHDEIECFGGLFALKPYVEIRDN